MGICAKRQFLGALLTGALVLASPLLYGAPTWVLVDTGNDSLLVLRGDDVVHTFRPISVGRGGVAMHRRSGDRKTPKGVFYVNWVNPESRYHLFFGLDYPSPYHAEEAFQHRVIDAATLRRIREAREHHKLPPQDTALGGYIGIHGTGSLDPTIQRLFDWTDGCIALTNEQVDQLARWVNIGTMVVIR